MLKFKNDRKHQSDSPRSSNDYIAYPFERYTCLCRARVPVQTPVDYLEAGDSFADFLADFPGVSLEHAIAVLELAKSALLAKAVAAELIGGWCSGFALYVNLNLKFHRF